MAFYSYKDCYGVVDSDFEKEWCDKHGIDIGELMGGDPLDFPQWSMMADYITYLKSKIKEQQ